ncbi:MAG: DsrE family protein [Thermodesulfobacteriota bacterium]
MKSDNRNFFTRGIVTLVSLVLFLAVGSSPAMAGDYDNALKDVNGVKVVFDVTQGSPKVANIVFWAVKDLYEAEATKSLPEETQVAVVFHGPAVKLISSDRSPFQKEDYGEIDKFHDTLRQLKEDGVKLEVCLYAAKVMGVDPATILPEIKRVANGFISVSGYQAQGYGVIRVP